MSCRVVVVTGGHGRVVGRPPHTGPRRPRIKLQVRSVATQYEQPSAEWTDQCRVQTAATSTATSASDTTSSGRTSAACRLLPRRPPRRRQTLHQVDGPVPRADSCHVDRHLSVRHYIKWVDQCRMQTPATSTATSASDTTSSGRTSAACRLPRRPSTTRRRLSGARVNWKTRRTTIGRRCAAA